MENKANKSLEVKNLSFTFVKKGEKDFVALKNVNFKFKQGDVVALLGPSGAGKTTLLRCLAGFLNHEGQVILNEEDISNIQTRDRDIAYIFQKPFLYPHLTIYANVCQALKYFGLTRDEVDHYAKDYIERYKMTKFINFKPRHLSVGEQQKVCLIRGLIREPSLLLLDEPFANIDASFKEEICNLIFKDIKDQGVPTIYVTHDLHEATRRANKIMLIENGEIVEYIPVEEFIKNPKSSLGQEYHKLLEVIDS